MSGFIANANPTPPATIENAPFWPAIDVAQVRDRMRLDGSISNERLVAALVAGMLAVNDDLRTWQAEQEAAGYAELSSMPDTRVGGTPRRVHLYLRAVACAAAVEVSERYRSADATDSGNQRADDLTPSISELRRDQRWAVSDLQGRPRSTVELV